MFALNSIIVLLLVSIVFIYGDVSNNTFVPSKEWQTIPEGHSVPAGLHVRINLKTGKKEAKLIDDSSARTDLTALPESEDDKKQNESTQPSSKRLSEQLENALKKIPSDKLEYSKEKFKELKNRFKSYKEIKKSFQDINMDIKTDAQIINNLIMLYGNLTKLPSDEKTHIRILEDLEYLSHQIDNALRFIDDGGLETVILPAVVNQTNTNIKRKSLRLLGTITQNNPKAQISAFERNFGTYLSQVLISSSKSEELSSAVYAFGSLLRKFPHAQKEVLSKIGTKALLGVFNKTVELKVKVKVTTLIADLLTEKEQVINAEGDQPNPEKLLQYKELKLDVWLIENRFCEVINEFFMESRNELLKDSTMADYLTQSLEVTQNLCFDVWSESPNFRHALLVIKNTFQGTEDDYLVEIAARTNKIYKKLFGHLKFKDEL